MIIQDLDTTEIVGRAPVLAADGELECRLYDSIRDVDLDDWRRLAGDDVGMDPRLIRVLEDTMSNQCRMWVAVIHDAGGTAVASAGLCRFAVDAMLTARPPLRKLTDLVRQGWPDCLRFGVLFCGLPVPAGENHLRIAPGANRATVLQTLHAAMGRLATEHGARLLVFRELDSSRAREFTALGDLGYLRGAAPPVHLMDARFRSFAEYHRALKSRYRYQVNHSIRKFERAGFRAVHVQDSNAIQRLYTREVHGLYDAVWMRAKARMEKFPIDFFRRLAPQFPGQASLTLIYRDDRVAAFTFGLASAKVYHSLYSGIDYSLNGDGDLYFNLFYHDLDQAFARGFREIQLGQTSDDFKARLGCRQRPLSFYARAHGKVWQSGLRAFSPLVFPAVPTVEPHAVFKANGHE